MIWQLLRILYLSYVVLQFWLKSKPMKIGASLQMRTVDGLVLMTLQNLIQVILFEIDCAIFYTNLHELFCQFISWTNWVNYGKFMDNCWISCLVMADMKKVYDDLIIINLYQKQKFSVKLLHHKISYISKILKDT